MSDCDDVLDMVDALDVRPELLRGTRLSVVVGDFGASWRTSPIDLPVHKRAALWGKSSQHERIDAFLSQTWHAPGSQRYLALLLRFYWVPAVSAGMITLVGLVALDLYGQLPTLSDLDAPRLGWAGIARTSPWSPLPSIASLSILFVSPWVPATRDRVVFFDALCINQVDEDLKTEGVRSIGGFVAKSEEFFLMWSKDYFRRAWCIFELAIFMALRKDGAIRFYSLFATNTVFAGVLTVAAWVVVANVSDVLGMLDAPKFCFWLLRLAITLPTPILIHGFRRYNVDLSDLNVQLTNFNLGDAICREASDMRFIKRAVVSLYGSEDQFNVVVRTSLRRTVLELEGGSELSFRHYATIVSPLAAYSAQQLASFYRAGEDSPDGLLRAVGAHATLQFLVLPAWIRIHLVISKFYCKPRAHIMMDVALTLAISVSLMAGSLGTLYAAIVLTNSVRHGHLIWFTMGCAITSLVFGHDAMSVLGKQATVVKKFYINLRSGIASAEAANDV